MFYNGCGDNMAIKYELIHECTQTGARYGKLHTPHGVFETPIFMPVGTVASVKGVHQRELKNDIVEELSLASLQSTPRHMNAFERSNNNNNKPNSEYAPCRKASNAI